MAAIKKRTPPIPGVPSSRAPSLEEPTTPAGPLPPKDDQGGPDTLTPTGIQTVSRRRASASRVSS